MPCWSHRSEMATCSRRWSRRMATFSGAANRLRVFLAMGKPPLGIVAYSSGPFFPFRLKQNTTDFSQLAVHSQLHLPQMSRIEKKWHSDHYHKERLLGGS